MTMVVVVTVAVIVVLLILQQIRTRNRWRQMRKSVQVSLDVPLDDLAAKHPNALRDQLCMVREVEAIHHAVARDGRGRARDRQAASTRCSEATEAAAKLTRAITLSVQRRVDMGVVTPSTSFTTETEAAK